MRFEGLAALAAMVAAVPAVAEVVHFSAYGVVQDQSGELQPPDCGAIGTPFRIAFDFDTPQSGRPFDSETGYANYNDFGVSNFTASVGGYSFLLNPAPFSAGLSFFGNPQGHEDPTSFLLASFRFEGYLASPAGANPLRLTPNSVQAIFVTETFYFTGDNVTIRADALANPGVPQTRSF